MQLKRFDIHPSAYPLGCDRSLRLLHCTQGGGEGGRAGGEDAKPVEEKVAVEEKVEVFACDVLKVREGARKRGRQGGREGTREVEGDLGLRERGKGREGRGRREREGEEKEEKERRISWSYQISPSCFFPYLPTYLSCRCLSVTTLLTLLFALQSCTICPPRPTGTS